MENGKCFLSLSLAMTFRTTVVSSPNVLLCHIYKLSFPPFKYILTLFSNTWGYGKCSLIEFLKTRNLSYLNKKTSNE